MARILLVVVFLPSLINILSGGPVNVGDQPLGLSPSDEDECVLKITIKALQEYDAGITSCDTLSENLNEAKGCPGGDETMTLVHVLQEEYKQWCTQKDRNGDIINSTRLFPRPSPEEQCLLTVTINLFQDDDLTGIENCGSLTDALEQLDECPPGPATEALENELKSLIDQFCDKNDHSFGD